MDIFMESIEMMKFGIDKLAPHKEDHGQKWMAYLSISLLIIVEQLLELIQVMKFSIGKIFGDNGRS